MGEAFHLWKSWLRDYEHKSANSVLAYTQGLRRVIDIAGVEPRSFKPDDMEQARLTNIVTEMSGSASTNRSTINQTLAAVKSFYEFCAHDGLSGTGPDLERLRKVANLEREPKEDPVYYEGPELTKLFEAASKDRAKDELGAGMMWPVRDHAMLSFLAALGLRAVELYTADVEWIRPIDEETVVFAVAGKGMKTRYIPMTPELIDVNQEWQIERASRFGNRSRRESPPLFVTVTGERFDYQRLRYWLRALNRAAHVPDHSLHALRHTAGVQWAADGVPLNEIQHLLGHENIQTTGIYTNLAGVGSSRAIPGSLANRLAGRRAPDMGN